MPGQTERERERPKPRLNINQDNLCAVKYNLIFMGQLMTWRKSFWLIFCFYFVDFFSFCKIGIKIANVCLEISIRFICRMALNAPLKLLIFDYLINQSMYSKMAFHTVFLEISNGRVNNVSCWDVLLKVGDFLAKHLMHAQESGATARDL